MTNVYIEIQSRPIPFTFCWEARKILLFKKSAAGIYFDGERLLINKHVHRSMLSHKKEDLTTASRG
jgi:hypothetical protein